MSVLVACAVAGAVVSALVPLAAIPLLRRSQVVDVETERSSHRGVALRGLGVAPWAGIAVALVAFVALAPSEIYLPALAMAAGLGVGIVGFVEDTTGLSIRVRAGLQMLIGLVLAAAVGLFDSNGVIAVLFFGAFFVAYVNVTNFMDGVDGISGIHGVAVGMSFALVGGFAEISWLVMLGLLIAGAFGAFVFWNVGPELRFLGDIGSYLLGGSIAGTVIAAYSAGVPLWALVSPLILYIADATYTLLRRAVAKETLYEAHREHVYQRLAASPKLGHVRVALIYGAVTAVLGLGGATVAIAPETIATVVAAQAVLVVVFFVVVERRLAAGSTHRHQAATK